MSGNVVSLRPTHDVVDQMRAFEYQEVETAVVVLARETRRNAGKEIEHGISYETFVWGEKDGMFTVRGVLATAITNMGG